jgi:site-specific DNA-methyltransferase (adenine-specific)/modification methylase
MTPYYQSPDGKITLYLGDCREILPVVAPPSDNMIVLADPPYGVGHTRNINRASVDGEIRKGPGRLKTGKNRVWSSLHADDESFDPTHLLAYQRCLVWGWNHFSACLPPTPSLVLWDKREAFGADDGADGEAAWSNLGGPLRIFRHFWRGALRASEKNDGPHVHPTQKPEAFYRWLFAGRGRGKPIVNPGDIVVSPYLGSGPEIAPTMELGLTFIGIDIEPKFLDTAIKHRIEPALARAKQLDIWAPKPKREEQLALV